MNGDVFHKIQIGDFHVGDMVMIKFNDDFGKIGKVIFIKKYVNSVDVTVKIVGEAGSKIYGLSSSLEKLNEKVIFT